MQRRQFMISGSTMVLGVSLAGCGFHLRGQVPLAFKSVFIQGAPNSPIVNQLKRLLASQVRVLEDADRNSAEVILLVHDERQERVATVPGVSGKVREVELRQWFDFSLATPAGKTLIDHAQLRMVRDVSYNESEAPAKEAEFEVLYRDMRNDVVQQVLRRLSAVHTL